MKLNFDRRKSYDEEEIVAELVRARLFEDYKLLDSCDEPEKLKNAYRSVLEYITVHTDERLKSLS